MQQRCLLVARTSFDNGHGRNRVVSKLIVQTQASGGLEDVRRAARAKESDRKWGIHLAEPYIEAFRTTARLEYGKRSVTGLRVS